MPDQKRIFIIHGWGGNPKEAWLPWLGNNLRRKGFSVDIPEMPAALEAVFKIAQAETKLNEAE